VSDEDNGRHEEEKPAHVFTLAWRILQARSTAYTHALVAQVREELGARAVGVYLFGSAALGDYRPPRSDLDVAVVAAGPIPAAMTEGVVRRLDHRNLPCPARKLEFVVYESGRLAAGDLSFELDLNTGPGLHEWRTDPAAAPAYWYVLDVAIARERAPALYGPAAADVFPEPDRARVLAALRDSLEWHLLNTGKSAEAADTVLNACRAWLYVDEGRWSSKTEAGRWAAGRAGMPDAVARAVERRDGAGAGPSVAEAREFARGVASLLGAKPPRPRP
jgi:predicted nucleotidyltransferase